MTLPEARPRDEQVVEHRRAPGGPGRRSSSTVVARRSCSCSETPAVVGETVKSRGVTTPRSPPPRSVTSRNSASRSSMRISASAAESPERDGRAPTSSITSRAGAVAGRPSTRTRCRSSASVTSPNRPSSERHDGVRRCRGASSRRATSADRVVGVDHQRLRSRSARRRGCRADDDPLGRGDRRPARRGTGRRCREAKAGSTADSGIAATVDRVGGHRPRPDRPLGQHGGEAEDPAGPEPLVGGVAELARRRSTGPPARSSTTKTSTLGPA